MEKMKHAIDMYFDCGIDPGSFLVAIINMDYEEILLKAHASLTASSIRELITYSINKKSQLSYEKIPKSTIETINLYDEKGCEPGSFVYHVLCNNLSSACKTADCHNQNAILEIVKYLYNEIDFMAWGSPKKVKAWLDHKRNKSN